MNIDFNFLDFCILVAVFGILAILAGVVFKKINVIDSVVYAVIFWAVCGVGLALQYQAKGPSFFNDEYVRAVNTKFVIVKSYPLKDLANGPQNMPANYVWKTAADGVNDTVWGFYVQQGANVSPVMISNQKVKVVYKRNAEPRFEVDEQVDHIQTHSRVDRYFGVKTLDKWVDDSEWSSQEVDENGWPLSTYKQLKQAPSAQVKNGQLWVHGKRLYVNAKVKLPNYHFATDRDGGYDNTDDQNWRYKLILPSNTQSVLQVASLNSMRPK